MWITGINTRRAGTKLVFSHSSDCSGMFQIIISTTIDHDSDYNNNNSNTNNAKIIIIVNNNNNKSKNKNKIDY